MQMSIQKEGVAVKFNNTGEFCDAIPHLHHKEEPHNGAQVLSEGVAMGKHWKPDDRVWNLIVFRYSGQ